MTTWCSYLKSSIESDSKWKASIPFPSSHARSLNESINRNVSFGGLSRSSSFSSISSKGGINENLIDTCNDTHNINDLYHSNNVIFEHQTLENKQFDLSNINIMELSKVNNKFINKSDDYSTSSESTNHSQHKFDTKSHVDIVELMRDDNSELSSILSSIAVVNLYPKNALFHFEGYNGRESKDNLIEEIKKSAFKTGTVLSIHKTNSSNSMLSVVLGCNHYDAPKKTLTNCWKTFDPNLFQSSICYCNNC